jgi:hypothetical protein
MKYQITINKFSSVSEIPAAWNNSDYIALLKEFEFEDAESVSPNELQEMLFMAISNFEGPDAAEILLKYKLSEKLNEGQIQQISHDMLEDKVSEEYPDIGLHAPLFDINQLLYKAYNATFPSVKASIIEINITPITGGDKELTKEAILKTFKNALSERYVMKRIFEDQLNGEIAFPEAEDILCQCIPVGGRNYKLITSDYWITKEDFLSTEFEGEAKAFEENEE